jgi:hypothetical protein
MAAPLALVGMGATVLGGITQAQGQEKLGEANLIQNYYQSGIAQMNAQIARQNADYAINVGEQQAQTRGLAGGQQLGQIVAAQASSGLDVGSGSARAVQESQREIIGLDTTQIRSNAAKAAYDYNVQAANFDATSQLYQMAGTNAAQAGQIQAESSILGTVGSVATKWSQGQQVGLFSGVGDIGGIGSMPATGAGSPNNFLSGAWALTQGINPF